MSSRLTIVTYHFVRDIARSRYPAIKGLPLEAFRGQLNYLQRHYQVVTMEDVLDALAQPVPDLPARAALLTFDDGYIDHFENVFPLLDEAGVQGSFFMPAAPALDDVVLDVNKIHFVLASAPSSSELFDRALRAVDARRERFGLQSGAEYWSQFDEASRFDTRETTFIKRLLQRILPEEPRGEIVGELFSHYVTKDEAAFARELYMTTDQLRCMHRHGMFVGSHAYSHLWLDSVGHDIVAREVGQSLEFLRTIDPAMTRWVMCYPYGGYSATTLDVLRTFACSAALTVRPAIADLATDDPLLLPRLDTNDLPVRGDAAVGRWTLDVETAQ